MSLRIAPFIGRHDSVSWVTQYTGLHALSGYVIAKASDGLDLSVDAAIGSAVGLGVGWEIVEYWMAPVLGYWAVRNTANTAIDMVAVLGLFMATCKAAPPWHAGSDDLKNVAGLGVIAGISAQLRSYVPEEQLVQGKLQMGTLKGIKALRAALSKPLRPAMDWLRASDEHELNPPNEDEHKLIELIEVIPLTGEENKSSSLKPAIVGPQEDVLQRPLLSPPHRMLAALCAIVIAVCAQFDWHALPTNLIAALVGFALTFPFTKIVTQKNNITDKVSSVPNVPEGEREGLGGCPFYRVWPQFSKDAKRHKGRDKARTLFRVVCLPVRYILMLLLLLVGPRVTWSRVTFLVLGAMAFGFVAFRLWQEDELNPDRKPVWWSREYLLLEISAIIVLFALLDHATACYASCALLAVHWTVSVWLSGFWPATEVAAVQLAQHGGDLTSGGLHSVVLRF